MEITAITLGYPAQECLVVPVYVLPDHRLSRILWDTDKQFFPEENTPVPPLERGLVKVVFFPFGRDYFPHSGEQTVRKLGYKPVHPVALALAYAKAGQILNSYGHYRFMTQWPLEGYSIPENLWEMDKVKFGHFEIHANAHISSQGRFGSDGCLAIQEIVE